MMELVNYSSYGVAFGFSAVDTDNGGVMAIVIKVKSIILITGYRRTMYATTLIWI